MRETQRQIEKYKAQLPHMRERVVASLLLLVVAAVTMVSASFAWIVLSSNPEVKGMNTTITSNGSLEIALASGTAITQPNDSEVGDSGKDLAVKNTTWGNLINLGDPIYGLENIVLRPAKLNTNSLLESPLYAAGYGTDGRVDALESDFAFASWNGKAFLAQDVQYGVRTIASVTYEQVGKDEALAARVDAAESKMISAETDLRGIGQAEQIDDLGGLMQKYVQEMIDRRIDNRPEAIIKVNAHEIKSIYELMGKLQGNMEMIADALAESYNLQLVLRGSNSYYEANKFTGEELLTAEWTAIEAKMNAKNDGDATAVVPANKEWLKTLRTKYKNLNADIAKTELLLDRSDVVWSNLANTAEEDKKPELSPIINNVVNVASAKIEGTPLSSLSSIKEMLGLLGKNPLHVEVQGGYLKDVDQFIGGEGFKSKTIQLTITAPVLGNVKRDGYVTTYASNASNTAKYVLPEEFNTARSGAPNLKGTDPVAKDTFGMAVDFFVRTNASNSHLILQGSPIYKEREETVIVTIDGKNYTLYTISKDENSTTAVLMGDTYYYYDQATDALGDKIATKSELSMGGGTATVLTETVKYVVGYSGVNRVWEDSESAMLDSTSTTQGAGSCYVFYPATPEDQEKSLQLLEHFRVAFVDQSGKLLATANMDVKNCFAETGKVTVPLVLPEDGNSIMGSDGEKIFTITELNQNEATFISALIYLDGVGLTNDQVLAAGEIQGQLNLQFGTTADLDAMDDPVLMESKCRVTATMDGDDKVSFDIATAAQLKKTITATVEGYTPSKVEAYFLREINSTQGIRQEKMTFQPNGEGKWVGEHSFTAPGRYILREIFLDGVSYELDQEPIVFTVEGFTVSDLYCQDNGKTYMKTDKSFETAVSLTFASSNKMPTSVKGAFIHQETGNRTTVYFTRDTGSTWVGSATFTTSGEYRMDYLELDGQYFGLVEDHHVTINLYLGLSASVYADHTNFALEEGETREVNMSLIIKDDSGESISNLANVWLYYSNNGSGLQDQGLSAKMVWDPSDQTYRGIFPINEDKAGIYNYDYVTIDLQGVTSTLSVATTAPTITAISTVIPKYLSKDGFGEVFALNNSAAFTVRMENADSATLDAELKNEAGETYYVRGTMVDEGEEQVFTFKLPIIEGAQSGTWSLQRLYMTNVYGGKDNTLYDGSKENGPDTETEDKPLYTVADNYYIKWLEWTLADITNEGETQEPIIRVVSDVNVAFSDSDLNKSKDFGKNQAGEVTGTFGTSYTLSNLELEITAGSERKPLSEYGITVSDIKLNYSFDQADIQKSSGTVTNPFGGYTMDSTSWTNLTSVVKTTYELLSNEGTKYTIKANDNTKNISIAGWYKTDGKIEITLEDQSGNKTVLEESISSHNAPVYSVSSIAPTAKFTKTNPAVGVKFQVQSGDDSTEQLANSISADGLSATCYIKASSSGSGCGAICGGYTPSKVTVELIDSGNNFKSGSMEVISNGEASNILFEFKPTESGNSSDEQAVGSSSGTSKKVIGKDAKATQIILTDNNDISYTFDLPLEKQLSLTCER